jgi:hypothetical protein
MEEALDSKRLGRRRRRRRHRRRRHWIFRPIPSSSSHSGNELHRFTTLAMIGRQLLLLLLLEERRPRESTMMRWAIVGNGHVMYAANVGFQ